MKKRIAVCSLVLFLVMTCISPSAWAAEVNGIDNNESIELSGSEIPNEIMDETSSEIRDVMLDEYDSEIQNDTLDEPGEFISDDVKDTGIEFSEQGQAAQDIDVAESVGDVEETTETFSEFDNMESSGEITAMISEEGNGDTLDGDGTDEPQDEPSVCEENGHTWNEGISEVPPSCTETGTVVYTCLECNETKTEVIPAKGHQFGDWTVEKAATTKADGSEKRVCSECQKTETRVIPQIIRKVSSITLSKTEVTLTKGKTCQLKATVKPADVTSDKVTWKSSNTKVASVSSSGVVTAKGKGTATITCTAADGSGKKASCKVTVKIPVSSVKLNKTSATLKKGKTLTLKATVKPDNANNKKVTWKSSNTKVASVSSSGVVTAKGKGTATITCKATDGSGKKAICKVTVKIPVSSVKLNKTSATLKKGKTLTLKATVKPDNANNKKVTWKSSNTKVASVSSCGVVTAKGEGTATITCKATDGSGKTATCKVTVKVKTATASSSGSSSRTTPSTGASVYTGGGSTSASSGDMVWLSATGTKYHRRNDCGTMNPANARQVSRQDAINRGFDACKKCF